MNSRGITLVELIVVVAIIAILAVSLGISYDTWISKYKVEQALKEMHSDLINARGLAISRSRYYFVDFTGTTYSVIEDTDDNLAANEAALATFPKTVGYTINNNFTGTRITFDRRGISSPNGSFWLTLANDADAGADYDCIVVSSTRINMGKWEECDSSHAGKECCDR